MVHVTVAMLLFPWIWAFLVVPDGLGVLSRSSPDALGKGALFGFLWGVGGIMFGVSSTLGVVIGEWKGAHKPLKTIFGGIVVVIFAISLRQAEYCKNHFFDKHAEAHANGDGLRSWPEFKSHKAKVDAMQSSSIENQGKQPSTGVNHD